MGAMRWYYVDPGNPAEVGQRDAVLARIDAWWRAFQLQNGELVRLFKRHSDWDLPGWMYTTLQGVVPI